MNVAVPAVIPVQIGLLAWLEARGCRTFPSMTAGLSHIDARLAPIRARFVALDAKRNGGGHVGVDHPRPMEMRE
jgi:hypothetical protein